MSNVNAYLNLVASRIQSDFAGEFEAQLNELLTYVKKRADAGASSSSDEGRVRARVLTAKSSRLEQEAAHAASGLDFFRLTNTAPKIVRLPEVADVGGVNLPKDLNAAIALAMDKNPDLAALREELRASEIDKKAALGRFLPRLDLEMTDTATDNAQGNRVNQKDQRLMVVMNWNLINGGGDVQYTQERKAKQKELEYKLDDQRRKVVQSLSSQYAILKATRERLVEGYKEMDSLSKAAKSMSQRMLYGNQSLLDLLDVYDRFYQAKSRLVNMHMQELLAIAQVSRMLEGGADERVALATGSQEVPHASTLEAAKGLPPIREVIAPGPAKADAKVKPKETAVADLPAVVKAPEPAPPPVLASELNKVADAKAPEAAAKPTAVEEVKPEGASLLPVAEASPADSLADTKPKQNAKDNLGKEKKLSEKPIKAKPEALAKEDTASAVPPAERKDQASAPASAPVAEAVPPKTESALAPLLPVAALSPSSEAAPSPAPSLSEKPAAELKPEVETKPEAESNTVWKRLFQAEQPKEKSPEDLTAAKVSTPLPPKEAAPVEKAVKAPVSPTRPAIKTIFCPPCAYGQECPVCESSPVVSDGSLAPTDTSPAVVPEAPAKRKPKKPNLSLSAVTPPLPVARY